MNKFKTKFGMDIHALFERPSLQHHRLRPCVPLTQLIELDSTLTKVIIGYITCELYITSFVKNNEFLAIITSFFDENSEFYYKNDI